MSNKKIRIVLASEDLVDYARKTPVTDEEVINAQQALINLKSHPKSTKSLWNIVILFSTIIKHNSI